MIEQAAFIAVGNRSTGRAFAEHVARSNATEGYSYLSDDTSRWLGGLRQQLPRQFWVHWDELSHVAARSVGSGGFTLDNHIFLADVPIERTEHVLRHEIVHLAQVELARRTGRVSPLDEVEAEAEALSSLPIATPVRHGASPLQIHRVIWFIAIGAAGYVLLRPSVANAPGPNDVTEASPSVGRIMAEALCLFAIPGGAMALGGRLGLGFLGSAALGGAGSNVGLRVVDDVARGGASHPLLYVFDAATGAVLGFVVAGGVRLIGQAGTKSLDWLATHGMRASDIALTRLLAQEAAKAPLTAAQAQQILRTRGMFGQVSQWWLNRRGVVVLYRGQDQVTEQILSPLARQEGVAASQEFVSRLRALGLTDREIATYTARFHGDPVPAQLAPPGLHFERLGAAGIPTTGIPGIAANFADGGVIYILRVPRNLPIEPRGWGGLAPLENEYIIFNQVPPGSIVQAIAASRVAPLTVNDVGLLVPGTR